MQYIKVSNMRCQLVTLKFFALLMNFFCGVAAVALISIHTIQLIYYGDIAGILPKIWLAYNIVNCGLLVITIINCYAIIQNSICLIWLYVFFIFAFIISESALMWLFPSNDEIAEGIIVNSFNTRQHFSEHNMEYFEMRLECCGKLGPNDYIQQAERIPVSCFQNFNQTINDTMYTIGCIPKLASYLNKFQIIEEICNIFLLALPCMSFALAVIFAINLYHERRRRLYR